LVYPDVNPLVIQIPTVFLAIFTIVMFIVKPPKKIKSIMARLSPGREKL